MTQPGSPILILSNGIPISPSDLDFGNSATQAQINALSNFSQMVNAIPSGGNVWDPTGSETWSIYYLVLSMAAFASQAQSPPLVNAQFNNRIVAVDQTSDSIEVPEPTPSVQSTAPAMLAALNQGVSLLLKDVGFEFPGIGSPLPAANSGVSLVEDSSTLVKTWFTPFPDNVAPPSADTSSVGVIQPTGLDLMFLQLKAQFNIAAKIDTLGATYYPTYLFPADFYKSQYDASWQSFEVTPGPNYPWAPVGQSGKVSGQMLTLPLQRSWWSTWVFSSRGWQFAPSSGLQPLSDGGSPAQGVMPVYASALVIARNIQVITADGAPAPPTHGDGGVQDDGTSTPDPTPMLIIAFVCTPLPKCPNPDPTLNWGN